MTYSDKSDKPVKLLIIAGSDCSGGAGIQADLKTATALGAYGMTAITAITVQNTQGVKSVMPITGQLVSDQARACIDDIGVDVIKTGMLGNSSLISAVAQIIATTPAFVVVDPVMVAKGGHALLEKQAIETLKDQLVPRADLLTPNIPEAEALTGLRITTFEDMFACATVLIQMGAKAVLLKGGHLDGSVITDGLFTRHDQFYFHHDRRDTPHTHGTGCTLASACASLWRKDKPLLEIVSQARQYVIKAIDHAPNFGHGHGPLNHMVRL